MIRQVIKIDESKCIGCGLCANACMQSAIQIIDGKAKLISEDYCDGMGNCMPHCPTDAISFETKQAPKFDKEAVKKHKESLQRQGCPSSGIRSLKKEESNTESNIKLTSQLRQWPVQIKLVPTNADYFEDAHLLVAADCTAYAYANFHSEYMKNKVTIIGCPKLDDEDYSEKLTTILKTNNIKSITIIRMEVPCCGGLEYAVKKALQTCGKMLPWSIITISIDGKILD